MQSKSATKNKKTKTAEVTSAVPVEPTASAPAQRASRSSQPQSSPQKGEPATATPAKSHRSAKKVLAPEESSTSNIGSSAPAPYVPSEEEVRRLAYHFWVERGQPNGSQHEDWFRAEQVLTAGA